MSRLLSNRKTLTAAGAALAIGAAAGLLVVQGNSGPTGSLLEAVRAGDSDLVRAWLDAGADPAGPQIFGLTPLMSAAIRDDAESVELLLDAGADRDATAPEGITAVHAAAQANAAASLEILVDAGADLRAMSHNGMSALHHAADLGSVRVIEFIAAQGMDLDVRSEVTTQGHGHPRDRGATALGIAARAGRIEAVETLIALGADVNALTASGHSPLLLAVFSGRSPEVVAALIAAGADLRIEASCEFGGCSSGPGDALKWAHELNEPVMVQLLEAAMQGQ